MSGAAKGRARNQKKIHNKRVEITLPDATSPEATSPNGTPYTYWHPHTYIHCTLSVTVGHRYAIPIYRLKLFINTSLLSFSLNVTMKIHCALGTFFLFSVAAFGIS